MLRVGDAKERWEEGITKDHQETLGFPDSSVGKESACNMGGLGSVHELEKSPGEGNGYLPQYSGLENSMDRGAWQATVHGIAKSWT